MDRQEELKAARRERAKKRRLLKKAMKIENNNHSYVSFEDLKNQVFDSPDGFVTIKRLVNMDGRNIQKGSIVKLDKSGKIDMDGINLLETLSKVSNFKGFVW